MRLHFSHTFGRVEPCSVLATYMAVVENGSFSFSSNNIPAKPLRRGHESLNGFDYGALLSWVQFSCSATAGLKPGESDSKYSPRAFTHALSYPEVSST